MSQQEERTENQILGVKGSRSFETRLDSLHQAYWICAQAFSCLRDLFCHTGEYKELWRVVNTSSKFLKQQREKRFETERQTSILVFYNLNLVFCFVILQCTVNCHINNLKSFQLKFNSINNLILSWSDISISDNTRNHLLLWYILCVYLTCWSTLSWNNALWATINLITQNWANV